MEPALKPGNLVIGFGNRVARLGRVVIIQHQGYEKIKRVTAIEESGLRLVGDNRAASTDSRDFGLVPLDTVVAIVRWPRMGV